MRNIQNEMGYPKTVFLISPIYQSIRDFKDSTIRLGAGDANCFKPFFMEVWDWVDKLYFAYNPRDEIW